MAPAHRDGREGRDLLRGALADLRKVKTTGVIPRSQARTIAVSSRPLMTVSRVQNTLRWVGATPLRFSPGFSSTSTLSSTKSVPRRSQTATTGSTRLVPASSTTRGLSCSGPRTTAPVPGSSQPRGLSSSSSRSTPPSRSTPRTSSVRGSQDASGFEHMNIAVSNDSMPAAAVNIALCSVSASTLAKYKLKKRGKSISLVFLLYFVYIMH